MIACSVRAVTVGDDTAGAENDGAPTMAETTPHGPPSQSIIIAAQESKAMPTGPSITQAMSAISAAHRGYPGDIAVMIACDSGLDRVQAEAQSLSPSDEREHRQRVGSIDAVTSSGAAGPGQDPRGLDGGAAWTAAL